MKSKYILLFCGLFLLLSACKKTIEFPAGPNSRIESYKVPVSDGEISGVIDESDKTITVYVPFYYQLDVIDPKISLAAGATLKETVVPVNVLDDKTIYTVTGADKSVSTYKLIIKIQQISPLVVTEVSTETATTKWAIGAANISVSGNFNTNDVTKVKVYLVGSDGKENLLPPSPSTPIGIRPLLNGSQKIYILGDLQVPQNIDPGTYKVRVKVQSLSTDLKYPVEIIYGQPVINFAGIIGKQGSTITLKSSTQVFYKFTEFSILVAGVKTVLPIVSYDRTTAIIRIPEQVPTGVYAPTAVFEGWPAMNFSWTVTVTDK